MIEQEYRHQGFVIGLLAGTCVGAGLAMWLAPGVASEVRERVAESAKALAKRGEEARDDAAGVVARAAHEVERIANAARSDGIL